MQVSTANINQNRFEVMQFHPNEFLIIFKENDQQAKQAQVYAKSICTHVRTVNFCKEPITSTQWQTLLDKLKINANELLDKDHDDFETIVNGKDYGERDWLEVLTHHPKLIKYGLAFYKQKGLIIRNPSDILKLAD